MIKKKFLFRDQWFLGEEPFIIATLLGSGSGAVTFHIPSAETGAMVNFTVSKVESGGLLDDSFDYPQIDECLNAIRAAGGDFSSIKVSILTTQWDESVLPPGKLEFVLDKLKSKLESEGAADIETRVEQHPGMKVFFKNWENGIRVVGTGLPPYCMAENPGPHEKTTILVVDDSSLIQNILKRTLADDPELEVMGTASDVFAAAEQIMEWDPDVILLDVIMPQTNGIQFLEELMHYYPKPVVIFSTLGKTGGNVQQQAMELGAVDVIDKRKFSLNNKDSIQVIRETLKLATTVKKV